MRAISKEKCILDGKLGLENLFEFVHENAESMQAYEMEKNIFRYPIQKTWKGSNVKAIYGPKY